MAPAIEAAHELALYGIDAAVVNCRFAKPLDSELIIKLAARVKRIVTVEENTLSGGFGSSIAQLLQESDMCEIKVKSIGITDEFVEQGSQAILRSKYNLDAEGIARQVLTRFPGRESQSTRKGRGRVGAAKIET